MMMKKKSTHITPTKYPSLDGRTDDNRLICPVPLDLSFLEAKTMKGTCSEKKTMVVSNVCMNRHNLTVPTRACIRQTSFPSIKRTRRSDLRSLRKQRVSKKRKKDCLRESLATKIRRSQHSQ